MSRVFSLQGRITLCTLYYFSYYSFFSSYMKDDYLKNPSILLILKIATLTLVPSVSVALAIG